MKEGTSKMVSYFFGKIRKGEWHRINLYMADILTG